MAGVRPLVTIGIPTYQRPELLQRALNCVAAQDYPNIELIVADNHTPGDAVTQIVDAFRSRIAGLVFIRHPSNIGAYANFFAILDAAHGEYFMWLADDDEISSNYVSGLVGELQANPDASSAAGHWISVLDQDERWPRSTVSFPQKSVLLRTLRFIWRTDDAFFFALHRTAALREASFPGYWWPNKGVLLNWGYPFLLDLVMRGRVLLAADASVRFFNYNSIAPKQYLDQRGGLAEMFRFCVRRLNIHWLYMRKIAAVVGVRVLAPAAVVSVVTLVREIGGYLIDSVLTKLNRPPPVIAGKRTGTSP
jgi:glycosyltransferase involved in cell wall biosynthesis